MLRAHLYWILMACLSLSSCQSAPDDTKETRFMMGTLVTFTIDHADKQQAKKAIRAAADAMQAIEDKFTIYGMKTNPIKSFNQSPVGTAFVFDTNTTKLLQIAVQIEQQSHGAFNPALGKLDKLWGFSSNYTPKKPPSTALIQKYKQGIQHCLQHINGNTWMRTTANCQLDLGAIAKGFAIDKGIEILKEHGVKNAMINAGGDIRLIGMHHHKPWRIGIRDPRHKEQVTATLSLSGNVSIVTSGDYERYFIFQGKRYHHILNPNTGFPSMTSQSTTVIASNATLADAWSTASFVLGKQSLDLAHKFGFKLLMVNRDGHQLLTKDMPIDLPTLP